MDSHTKTEKNGKKGTVTVVVNEQKVTFDTVHVTGLVIKEIAIAQGVPIEKNFTLEEQLTDIKTRHIEDDEKVHLIEHIHFIATPSEIIISVNEQPVKFHVHIANGAQIKATAIAQGVLIEQNFILQEELPNGTSRIIGDSDKVRLRPHLRFTAIAPDDNS